MKVLTLSRRLLLKTLGAGTASVLSIGSPRLGAAATHAARRSIVVVPLGGVPEVELRTVERALAAFYAGQIEVFASLPLPASAFYAPRKRYRAEKLLQSLEAGAPSAAFRVLGLTHVDISTSKGNVHDWGILGLATLDGRVGVLSSFRCRRGAKDARHVAARLGKTAVHELGHTFGLEHCPQRGCLMEDARGTVLTTDRECDLCRTCREKLGQKGLLAEPRGDVPWPCR